MISDNAKPQMFSQMKMNFELYNLFKWHKVYKYTVFQERNEGNVEKSIVICTNLIDFYILKYWKKGHCTPLEEICLSRTEIVN